MTQIFLNAVSFRRAIRLALPGVIIAVLVITPFLGKAFTIDDTLFLSQADHLLVDPLHPTAFEIVWSLEPERMSAITPNGPLMAYLLLPCVALGYREWIAHLLQLLFLVLAVCATASLALRLGGSDTGARTAALLLSATPVSLAMTGTAMPDIPSMAFGVLGVERILAWKQEGRFHRAASGAFFLSFAALCRPHLILMPGIAFLACSGDILNWKNQAHPDSRSFIPLLAIPAIILAALVVTRDPQTPFSVISHAAGRYSSLSSAPGNIIAFFVHWVLAVPLAVPWVLLYPARVLRRPVLYIVSAAAFLFLKNSATANPFVIAPIAGIGAAVLWDLLCDSIARRDSTDFVLGLWLLMPVLVIPYLHLPSKYLLVSAPAAAILVSRSLFDHVRLRWPHLIIGAVVVFGIVLGVLILRADSAFAGLGRRASSELISPQIASGNTVWYAGHWGFQWYAERAGARPVSIRPPYPKSGDLVVSSDHSGGDMINFLPSSRLLQVISDDSPGGRLMSAEAGAGFFSNGWGYLPWGWGREPLDRYYLWVVE